MTQNQTETSIPEGVPFGSKVLLLPRLPGELDLAIWRQNAVKDSHPQKYFTYGGWIERGAPLYTFGFPGSVFKSGTRIDVISPVSGMVLSYGNKPFEGTQEQASAYLAILLPRVFGEPLSMKTVFGPLLTFCFDNHDRLFGQGSELQDRPEYEKATLERRFSAFLKQDYPIIDLLEDRIALNRLIHGADDYPMDDLLTDLSGKSPEHAAILAPLRR